MIRYSRTIGLFLTLCLGFQVAAQTVSRTSYFVENSTHRHLMNPALAPVRGYLALPVAGEVFLGTESNMKLTNFIYPAVEGSEGKPITFLHRSISASDFLTTLNEDQNLHADIRSSILSLGMYLGKTGFFTFDLATRANVSLNLPRDLFVFAKQGMSSSAGNTYHLDNLQVDAYAIGEAALGYSVNLTEAMRIGMKGKILAGGAYLKAGLKQMELKMTPDEWSVTSQGQLDLYGQDLSFLKDKDGNINNFKMGNPGLGGMGMAFDLGMEWAPIKNIKLSAAIVDFGNIRWNKANNHSAASNGTFTFSGIENFNPDSVGQLAAEDQLNNMKDNLMELTHFKEQTAVENFVQKLNPTVNLGIELTSKRVSLGGLYSTRLMNGTRYSELTTSLNLKPFNWVNLSGSYSFMHGNQETIGFALGLTPGIVNIFVACDYIPLKVGVYKSMPIIPLHTLTTNFQVGISIPLSKRREMPTDDSLEEDQEPQEVNPADIQY